MISLANDAPAVFRQSYQAKVNLASVLRDAIQAARAPKLRTYREFAEQEIVIPEGKYEGQRFRTHTQPYAGPLLDAYDSGNWNRFAITGCVQSGKTLTALVIVVLYHLFETKEKVILAAPNMVTCQEKWKRELLPIIERNSRMLQYLPTTGKGSRRGQADEIAFTNGAVLKFMTAGGGDETRSHYTARVVVITEADKMDESSETSREADPVTQIEARTESFEEDKRVFIECTVSVETGRIWSEKKNGSDTELYVQCGHCRHPFCPGREHLKGWQLTESEIEARDNAFFECPKCKGRIDDAMRNSMLQDVYPVHRGQTITVGRDGNALVDGPLPKTTTFGYRWGAFFNRMWRIGHIAMSEWRTDIAKQADADDFEDLEKKQRQWYWAVPWVPEDFNDFELTAQQVRQREGGYPRDVLPPDTEHLTCGVDIGKSTCWWFLAAFTKSGTVHVPAYGAFTAATDLDAAVELALLNSLREFRDSVMEPGFQVDGSDVRMVPDQVWIDSGYMTDVICSFVRESGRMRGNRYRPMAGRGKSQIKLTQYTQPAKRTTVIREIGNQWYAEIDRDQRVFKGIFNADYWKLWVQKRLVTEYGRPGAMTFYHASRKHERHHEHMRISRHLTNERFVRYEKPGRGLVEEWEKKGQNHWLDAAALACAAGDKAGYQLVDFDGAHSPSVEQMQEAVTSG